MEDEESLRELVSATLTEAGYAVIAAVSGLEALALWELHGESIDLLFTDMVISMIAANSAALMTTLAPNG